MSVFQNVFPVIDNEFLHNIVKVICESTRFVKLTTAKLANQIARLPVVAVVVKCCLESAEKCSDP